MKSTVPIEVQKQKEQRWIKVKEQPILKTFPSRTVKILNDPKTKLDEFKYPVPSSFLHGKARTGKTIQVSWMILEWNRTQFMNRGRCDFEFISVIRLLEDLRDSFNDMEKKTNLIYKYKNTALLVLDDFGAEKTTDWAFQMLYDIIDHRYNHEMTTFYTSNLSLNGLSEKLNDDRIPSRIAQDCKGNIIEFKNKPYI